MTDPQTYEEMRETIVRAVRWLRVSRARAAPDALTAIAYLAAREHILERQLQGIEAVLHGDLPTDSVRVDPGPTDHPSGAPRGTQSV